MAGAPRRKISDSDASTGVFTGSTKPLAMEHRATWEAREVMDIRQASEYLGISSDSLYKYASENVIPAFKLGNRWRFKRSLLDAWMEQQSSLGHVPAPDTSVRPKQKKPVSRVR